MATTTLHSTFVNHGGEAFPYLLDAGSHDARAELYRAYQPVLGPITKVVSYLGAGGGFHVYAGHAEYIDLDSVYRRLTAMPSLDTGVQNSLFGGGKGLTPADMQIGTVGEAVERVMGALCVFTGCVEQVLASSSDLSAQGLAHLGPDDLHLFAEEQYERGEVRYDRWTADTPLTWIEGRRLLAGEPVLVPAQLVEMLHFFHPAEAAIGYSVSGGLSCHRDEREALYHGITEVIERDAINLRWTGGIKPHRVEFDRLPDDPRLRRQLEEILGPPTNARILYHNLDLPEVPVLTGVQLDPWLTRYSYNAGGGADLDADVCLQKALVEFGQSAKTLRLALLTPDRLTGAAVGRLFDMDPDAPVSSIDLFFKTIGYYGYTPNRERLAWYVEGNPVIPYSELPRLQPGEDKLDRLLDVLRGRGWDPIVFDFTPPQFRRLKVLKVFMPELSQPFLPSNPVLGHPRFARARMMAGLDTEPTPIDRFTVDPLPYP